MAGYVRLDYDDGSFIVKLFGGDGKLVDMYEVEGYKFDITNSAYFAIRKVKGDDDVRGE